MIILRFLAGVFNGDAAGPGTDDPQSRDRYGVNFKSMIRRLPSAKYNSPIIKKRTQRDCLAR